MNNEKEIRFAEIIPEFVTIDKRDGENDKMIIEGYAAVYDSKTRIGADDWGFDEIIERGAFNGANLKDVPLKYNHLDAVPILARTRNKSLTLTPDDKGLRIRAELIDTTDNIDMFKRIKAGLINKMSFAFTVADEQIDTTGKIPFRHIKKFDKIFDVSVVDTPAYEDTSVFARSREIAEAWRAVSDDTTGEGANNPTPAGLDMRTKILISQYAKKGF